MLAMACETQIGAEAGFTIADGCVRLLNWSIDKFVLLFFNKCNNCSI